MKENVSISDLLYKVRVNVTQVVAYSYQLPDFRLQFDYPAEDKSAIKQRYLDKASEWVQEKVKSGRKVDNIFNFAPWEARVWLTEEEKQIVWRAFGKKDMRIIFALEQVLELFLYHLEQREEYKKNGQNMDQIPWHARLTIAPYRTIQKIKKTGDVAVKIKALLSCCEVENGLLFFSNMSDETQQDYHLHKEQLLSALDLITSMAATVPDIGRNVTVNWRRIRLAIVKIWAAIHGRIPGRNEKAFDADEFHRLIDLINSIIEKEVSEVKRPKKELTVESFEKEIRNIRKNYISRYRKKSPDIKLPDNPLFVDIKEDNPLFANAKKRYTEYASRTGERRFVRAGELILRRASDTSDQTL